MGINRGKDFEAEIRSAFENVPNTSVVRLIDPQNGFAGVRNICDFIIYHYPYQYFIECKSHYGNTLPFDCITKNQKDGMLEMSKIPGVVAGVIVWFIDHDQTWFVPIETIFNEIKNGKKSLNIKTISELHNSLLLDATKKRIMFTYTLDSFIETTRKENYGNTET